jgi:hydrogenase 3 maturation protease
VAKAKFDVQNELKKWLTTGKRVVVAGIGNPIRMDDYVGMKIVQELQGKVSERTYLVECETVPEGFIQQIIAFNPTHVLLIDAAILGLNPGESRLIRPEQLTGFPAFSTHMLPLRIFCEYLEKATKARIALLLVEPKNVDFGEELSHEVNTSAQNIVRALLNILP